MIYIVTDESNLIGKSKISVEVRGNLKTKNVWDRWESIYPATIV